MTNRKRPLFLQHFLDGGSRFPCMNFLKSPWLQFTGTARAAKQSRESRAAALRTCCELSMRRCGPLSGSAVTVYGANAP